MITLTSNDILGTIVIRGHKVVFIENPITCYNWDWVKGKMLTLNGDLYRVIAVEARMHAPPWREGEEIGFMLKEESYYS